MAAVDRPTPEDDSQVEPPPGTASALGSSARAECETVDSAGEHRELDMVSTTLGWCLLLAGLIAVLFCRQAWERVGRHSPTPVLPHFRVDINAAEMREWRVLPNIGPALANRIVEHREQHGPFDSVDALLQVPGIGPKTLESLLPMLYLEPHD